MIRRTGQIIALLSVLLVLCALLLAVLPGSWLARQAASLASARLELSVEIDNLVMTPFSLNPGVTIEKVSIGQGPDAASVHAHEMVISLNLAALFTGELVFDRVSARDGGVEAAIDEYGRGNWQPSDDSEPSRIAALLQTVHTARIEELVLDSFHVHLVNEQMHTELSLEVDGVASTHDDASKAQLHVVGHADDQAVVVDAELAFPGDVHQLAGADKAPVLIDATASVGDDRLALSAVIGDRAATSNVTADFSANVLSPRHWQAFFPVQLPDLLPFSLAGKLTNDRESWLLQALKVKYGNTDFNGEIKAETEGRPVKLDARLMSARLDIDEIMHLQSIARRWMPFIGRIDYRAEEAVSDRWPAGIIDLVADLDRRQLSLLINRISFSGGEIDGEIISQLHSEPAHTQFRLNLKRVDLRELLPEIDGGGSGTGQLAARIELSTAGMSRASMLSSADGVVVAFMTGDWLDTVLETVLGAESAGSLMPGRGAPERSGKACAFLELQAADGIVQLRSLVFETDSTLYIGDGELDWQNQLIDLTIEPHEKKAEADASTDADGVYVHGPLASPVVTSVHPFLSRDSAKSVLDATISPVVALMPFLHEQSDGSAFACQGIASALNDPQ